MPEQNKPLIDSEQLVAVQERISEAFEVLAEGFRAAAGAFAATVERAFAEAVEQEVKNGRSQDDT